MLGHRFFKCILFDSIRGPFAKYGDSPYYSQSELYGGAVTVSFVVLLAEKQHKGLWRQNSLDWLTK
jgi:hypothetical protein